MEARSLGKRTFAQAARESTPTGRKDRRRHPAKQPSIPNTARSTGRCLLLELPAELRELVWIHAVTEWAPAGEAATGEALACEKRPIRMDRFNRPPPPPLTRVSRQLRAETLHLYYQENIFECWRPLFWHKDWSYSTFIDWLLSLGPERTSWLQHVVLLYKHEAELEHDVEEALAEEGFELPQGAISSKQELSEYEMCFETLGLPRHFGRKKRWDRWMAGSSSW